MNYYSNRGGNFLSNIPPVTKFLLIANVLLFLFAMVNPSIANLMQLNAIHNTVYYPGSPFKAYQLLTHMFMHGGWGHLFMNMFGLYMFGRVLETAIDSKKYFILYFLSGFGAAGLQLLVYYLQGAPGAMVGASGAIFGVVAAFATLYPNVELMVIPIPVPVKAKYLVPGFMVLSIVLGLSNIRGDFIAHFAHLGGAIIGFIFIKFWKKNQFKQF